MKTFFQVTWKFLELSFSYRTFTVIFNEFSNCLDNIETLQPSTKFLAVRRLPFTSALKFNIQSRENHTRAVLFFPFSKY